MPWTMLHFKTIIPTFLVMFGIAFFLARLFRNETEFVKLLPIRIIAIIIIFLEIMKQYLSIKQGYTLYHLPFHFCSMFVFLFPLFAFVKGRYKEHVRIITLISCTLLFAFMIIMPNTIYAPEDITLFLKDFFSFHTVFFHNIVIFGFFYIVNIKLYSLDLKRDLKTILIVFPLYGSVACVMSNMMKVNFNSFYYCQIPFIEDFRLWMIDKIEWGGHAIYTILLFIVSFVFILLCYWVFRSVVLFVEKIRLKRANEKSVAREKD